MYCVCMCVRMCVCVCAEVKAFLCSPPLQDFDLCVSCYTEVSHPHPMEKLGLGLELENPQSQVEASQKDPKEQRKASIEKCIRFLVHATQCHNPHCKQPSCIKMKRVLTHTRECRLMLSGKWTQCTICKQFVLLCISHAKSCNVDRCPVPVCARIKKNLRDQRVKANRFMQQRMAQMNTLNNNATAAAPPISSQASVASPAPPSSTSPGNSGQPVSQPYPTGQPMPKPYPTGQPVSQPYPAGWPWPKDVLLVAGHQPHYAPPQGHTHSLANPWPHPSPVSAT